MGYNTGHSGANQETAFCVPRKEFLFLLSLLIYEGFNINIVGRDFTIVLQLLRDISM